MISLLFDYDLLAGEIIDLSLASGTCNDQQDSKEVKENIGINELLIGDPGYVTMGYMKNVEDKQAYFLNKMSFFSFLFMILKRKVDLRALRRKMKKTKLSLTEQKVLTGSKEWFPCRMIAQEVYKARLDRAAKKAKKRGYPLIATYPALFMSTLPCLVQVIDQL